MDKQQCKNCKRMFDFDTGGFGSDHGGHVCNEKCAKAWSRKAGNKYVIHDGVSDAVVDTDASDEELAKENKPTL